MTRRSLLILLASCLVGCGDEPRHEDPSLAAMLSAHGTLTVPFERHPVGYIFLRGEVNGTAGKLMFDTGTPFYMLLNAHALDLGPFTPGPTGSASSGQQLQINIYEHVHEVRIAGQLSLQNLQTVQGSNFDFIEQALEPSFLGFLGEQFLNVRFLVNYDAKTVTLYAPQDPGPQETPLTVVQFGRRPGELPEAQMQVGGLPIMASFDTGSGGEFDLTPDAIEQLSTAGLLIPESPSDPETLYSLRGLQYAGASLTLHHLPLTVAKENRVQHYLFLKNFRSLWDFQYSTISLYPRSMQ